MTARPSEAGDGERAPTARQVWSLMCDVVFANVRRREASEAVGLSFGRLRAIRRLARQPMSMSELAHSLTIDPPNATVLVDELEALGLARRKAHPTDRRAKVVEATRKGRNVAERADEILSTPPPELDGLNDDDLKRLWGILAGVTTS